MKIFFIFILMFCVSCASMTPGGIIESKSEYDGAEQVEINPGWANGNWGSNNIRIGLIKTSAMKKNEVALIVRNNEISNFRLRGNSFFLMIDGKEHKFNTKSRMDCQISSGGDVAHCKRNYLISMDVVESILTAKKVSFKLLLEKGTFVAGKVVLDDSPTLAFGAFQEFKEIVKKKGMY